MERLAELNRRANEATSLEDLAELLSELLVGGYSVSPRGDLYYIKQLVARVRGLRIHVYAREHPPPHFHVESADVDATFTIDACKYLGGNIDGREVRLVEWWYAHAKPALIAAWNVSRPSDCPVGPIIE